MCALDHGLNKMNPHLENFARSHSKNENDKHEIKIKNWEFLLLLHKIMINELPGTMGQE